MTREQNLYQIFKFDSDFIIQHNLKIENYTPRIAVEHEQLVCVGDNIAFDQIRKIRGDKRTNEEVFKDISRARKDLREAKKNKDSETARVIALYIQSQLFVKDIVGVVALKKSDYRKIAKNGFFVNGKKFVRFSASAGQIRHNTVLFCSEEIYPTLYKILMCGLDERVESMNIAKLSAYFSLSTSSVMWVTKPRVCIIKDFFTTLKNQKIDWITNTESGKKTIEERTLDLELNSCDGQGLISPEMAKIWSNDMGLDYIASSFVTRTIFVKGNLVPFDFKEYAHRNGISTITDRYGTQYNIDDVDILLSESQFKMYKYYKSWEEYNSIASANGIRWGVARYNKKEDPEYSLTNYQYIQIMNINDNDIDELIAPTIDWIKKICSGDPLYAMLYSLGKFGPSISDDSEMAEEDYYLRENKLYTLTYDLNYNVVEARAKENLTMNAVVKNPEFLKDANVQRKIYQTITKAINLAKLGKIWMHGNYQFMISDPIAQCRSALGLPPTGEVPADYIYSKWWNDRGKTNQDVVFLRSPCLDKHEANTCKIYNSPEAEYWFQYIKSGYIYSIYDTSTLRHSDSDFDGDISAGYDSPVFVRGSQKATTNPISYDKQAVSSQKICHRNFIETDIRGFGTKVGTYSNYSTIIEAMLPNFSTETQQEQRAELYMRKQLLREINGQEIDRIKGVDAKGPPREEWLKLQLINEDDEDDIKANKLNHNLMVISKKPYFFRYLYPELNTLYKRYEDSYNHQCLAKFGCKLKHLISKKNKTPEEIRFLRTKYYRHLPLIKSNCTMNILCRKIEDVDFDIKWNKNSTSMLPYDPDMDVDTEILSHIRNIYSRFKNTTHLSITNDLVSFDGQDQFKEDYTIQTSIYDDLRAEYSALNLTPLQGLTYFRILSTQYKSFYWNVVWNIIGDNILDAIPSGNTVVPVESEDGEYYLGKRYKLEPVSKEKAIKVTIFDGMVIDARTGKILKEIDEEGNIYA